eukprot:1158730-Pelagomonas_calceolata.AAC.5
MHNCASACILFLELPYLGKLGAAFFWGMPNIYPDRADSDNSLTKQSPQCQTITQTEPTAVTGAVLTHHLCCMGLQGN